MSSSSYSVPRSVLFSSNDILQSEIFDAFLKQTSYLITGKPSQLDGVPFGDFDECYYAILSLRSVAYSLFGCDSYAYNYINLHLESMNGIAFVGPLPQAVQ